MAITGKQSIKENFWNTNISFIDSMLSLYILLDSNTDQRVSSNNNNSNNNNNIELGLNNLSNLHVCPAKA